MEYRYRDASEMKDSGVEWIGMIPREWDITKFKYVSLLYTGNSIKDSEKDNYSSNENAYPYIGTKDIISDYNKINYNNGMYTKTDDSKFRVAEEGSTLICIEGGSAGKKLSYLNQRVSFVNKLCCIQSNKIYSKFQYYYCNSDSFKKEFSLNLSGLIGGVSINSLNNFRLVNPSLYEQKKIANFLDKKISQFDYIISKKEGLIEKLEEGKKSLISEVVTGKMKVVKTADGYDLVKRSSDEMKDSGVEWLGKIPKDWLYIPLKYLANITGGYAFSSNEFRDDGIQIIKIANLYNNKLSLDRQPSFVGFDYLDSHKDFIVTKGDILISLTGTLGKRDYGYSIVLDDDRKFLLNQRVGKIKYKSNVNLKYGIYLLQNESYLTSLYSLPTGTKQANLSNEQVLSIKIPLPNINEQEILAEYLDLKVDLIESNIYKIKYQIEKLKEAKQSLISEAVTGKIEILD